MPVVWPWRHDRGPHGRSAGRGLGLDPDSVPTGSDGTGRPLSDPTFVAGLRPIPADVGLGAGQPSAGLPAPDIVGVSPTGDGVEVRIGEVEGSVVVAFLATRCDGCGEFWQGFASEAGRQLPPSVTAVIVTRGPDSTAATDVGRLAAGTGVPVIMSDGAWADYRVLSYPFLVLVDAATRTVVSETVGFGWSDLVRMVEGTGR